MCPVPWQQIFVGCSLLFGEAIAFWMLSVSDPNESKKKGHVEYFQSDDVRTYFLWKSGWFFFFLTGGLTMLFGALELEAYHLPIQYAMWLCYAFFLAAAIYCVGCWLASSYLRLRKNATSLNRYRREKWTFVILIVAFSAACEYAVYETEYHLELKRLEGKLEPACDPTPLPFCGFDKIPKGVVAVQFGDGTQGILGGLPSMVFMSKEFGPILGVFHPPDQDYLALYTDIRSRDGRIIARFDETGEFTINSGAALAIVRDDKSSLRIEDEFGDEVLKVRYANPQFIKISGIIRLPDRRSFTIGLTPFTGGMNFKCVSNGGNERTSLIGIP